MQPITVWSTQEFDSDHKPYWSHSHISEGHATSGIPDRKLDENGKPFQTQNGWGKQTWQKRHAHLVDNKVIYD